LSADIWNVWWQAVLNQDAKKGVVSAEDAAVIQFSEENIVTCEEIRIVLTTKPKT